MAQQTARDLISTALRRINVLDEGEVAEGNEAKDALARLNEITDGCNSYPLGMMWATSTVSIPLDGSSTYSLGPTGQFQGGVRPLNNQVLGAWVTTPDGTDHRLDLLDDDSYGRLLRKGMIGERPFGIYINGTFPNATISLFPVGATSGNLVIQYRGPIPPFTLQTVIALPPAYQRFLTWQLAIELAIEYGQEPTATAMNFAETARRDIIKNNSQVPNMQLGGRRGMYDINSDVVRSY